LRFSFMQTISTIPAVGQQHFAPRHAQSTGGSEPANRCQTLASPIAQFTLTHVFS
jgi:hypothetical protein